MVKSAALFYSLAISLLIALICSSLILTAFYSRVEFNSAMQLEKSRINAQSGLNILLSEKTTVPFGQITKWDLFGDGKDHVLLTRRQWGAFETVTAFASEGKFEQTLSAMIGSKIPGGDSIALWLSDNDKPLSLCGKTVIKGKCFLPESGVKRAYIEGQSFTGEKLIEGRILMSGKTLPPLDRDVISRSKKYLSLDFSETDSVINFGNLTGRDSFSNSFLNKTLVLFSSDPISLVQLQMSGNIIIVSENYIFISAQSKLADVIVYAPKVEIEKGFNGTLQIVGSDTVIINENCILAYPSVAGLIGKEKGGGIIRLKESAKISGAVFTDQEVMNQKNKTLIILEKNSLVQGMVYCSGMLELSGLVHGSVFCDMFILSTPSSVYENHLLNAEIDASKLPHHFIGTDMVKFFTGTTTHRGIVKWL